jgi:hypothetical protein
MTTMCASLPELLVFARSSLLALLALFAGPVTLSACSGAPPGDAGDDPETVQLGALELEGSIAARAFTQRYGWIMAAAGPTGFDLHFHTHGDVFLAAPGLGGDAASEGSPPRVEAGGIFRMPAEGPSAGGHLCAGPGSSYALSADADPDVDFELRALSELGVCPGEPVAGTIEACPREQTEPNGACPTGKHLTGTIAGTDLDWTEEVVGYRLLLGEDDGAALRVRLKNGSVLLLDLDADRVVGGLLSVPGEGDSPTVVYCVDGGSVTGDPASGPFRLQLDDLSRLGACGDRPIAGAISGRY